MFCLSQARFTMKINSERQEYLHRFNENNHNNYRTNEFLVGILFFAAKQSSEIFVKFMYPNRAANEPKFSIQQVQVQ